jgi:hypothetical protein
MVKFHLKYFDLLLIIFRLTYSSCIKSDYLLALLGS